MTISREQATAIADYAENLATGYARNQGFEDDLTTPSAESIVSQIARGWKVETTLKKVPMPQMISKYQGGSWTWYAIEAKGEGDEDWVAITGMALNRTILTMTLASKLRVKSVKTKAELQKLLELYA